jgi:hypothetical protein
VAFPNGYKMIERHDPEYGKRLKSKGAGWQTEERKISI